MFDLYDLRHEQEIMDEYIEKEMQRTKEHTFKNIRSIVHFETESFTTVLAYAWFDSHADAIKLAEKLNLSKLDFLAVMGDLEAFKEEYLKDLELAQNF